MKTAFFKITLLASLFLFAGQFVSAQNAIPAPPSCDQILSSTKAAMQKEADANCRSVTRCVACTDKKSAQVIYATMIVDPSAQRCKTAPTKAAGNTMAAERSPVKAAGKAAEILPETPVFEFLQERCEDGTGVNLDVYIAGNAMRCTKDQYAFLWEIDGGKGGHATRQECICGKVAQLTLTDTKTGLSQTKRVELLPCAKK